VLIKAVAAGLAGLLVLAAPPAGASVPEGPRLAFVRAGLGLDSVRIFSTDPIGAETQRIVGRRMYRQPLPFPFFTPSWSPDGSRLAYTGLVREFSLEAELLPTRIFLVSAEGGWSEAIPGTGGGFAPVFSPDGRTLAFSRQRLRWRADEERGLEVLYESAAVWLLDLATGSFRQLTPWRDGLMNTASAFSPDGRVLAINHSIAGGPSGTKLLRLDGAGAAKLIPGAVEAQYSPDGSRIAFLRGHRKVFREHSEGKNFTSESRITTFVTDLFEMRADGSGVRRLTKTPNRTESAASWDPSGERLAFTSIEAGTDEGFFGFGGELVEMNADGSCRKTILWEPLLIIAGPVWQPGPGREAGRIPC